MTIELVDDNGLIYNKRPLTQNLNWVVVHNGVNAIIFDNTLAEVNSQHTVVEFDTDQEAMDFMDANNISYEHLLEEDEEI